MKAEYRYAMQRYLRQVDEVEAYAVLQNTLGGESEQMLVDGEVTRAGCNHDHRQSGAR